MIAQQKFELSLTSGHAVTLANGSTMSAADILGLSGNNPEGAFAEVDRNPNDPLVLGLKNLTTKAWSASIAGGARRQIEPDRSIKLAADTEVSFGCVIGTIRQRANGFELVVEGGPSLPLIEGRKLTATGLMGMRSAAPRTPAAEIVSNPTDSAVFGLKNLSGLIWSVTVPGGSPRSLEPGKSVRLAAGTKINFGPVQAEITSAGAAGAAVAARSVRGGLVLIRPAVALILSALIGAGLVAYRGLSPFTTLAVIFFASLVVSFGLNIRRSGPIT